MIFSKNKLIDVRALDLDSADCRLEYASFDDCIKLCTLKHVDDDIQGIKEFLGDNVGDVWVAGGFAAAIANHVRYHNKKLPSGTSIPYGYGDIDVYVSDEQVWRRLFNKLKNREPKHQPPNLYNPDRVVKDSYSHLVEGGNRKEITINLIHVDNPNWSFGDIGYLLASFDINWCMYALDLVNDKVMWFPISNDSRVILNVSTKIFSYDTTNVIAPDNEFVIQQTMSRIKKYLHRRGPHAAIRETFTEKQLRKAVTYWAKRMYNEAKSSERIFPIY